MTANLYGTTADVEKLMHAFANGQATANTVNGFVTNIEPPVRELLEGVAQIAVKANGRAKQPVSEE